MTVTVNSSGTQSATPGTEHTLATITTAGVFTLLVDADALADGEILTLRIKAAVLGSGTVRVFYCGTVIGTLPADEEGLISVPIPYPGTASTSLVFTLQQVNGSSRSFPWSVLSM